MKPFLCAAIIIAAHAISAGSLANNNQMETITVTASRTPVSVENVGSSITILDRDEISRRGAINLGDLLRGVPGFAISQQGSSGALTQVRVRGAEANQVLVLIDGIEANDISQGSEFNFTHVLTRNVQRVEIVRGPQSALWGSDALAGVVNVITTDGRDGTGISGHAEYGSFDTTNAGIRLGHHNESRNLAFYVDYLDTDGTNISRTGDEKDGYQNTTMGANGEFNLTDNTDLVIALRNTDTLTDYDGTDFVTTGLPIDALYESDSTQRYGKAELTWRVSDMVEQTVTLAQTDTENVNREDGPINDETASTRDSIHLQTDLFMGAQTLSVVLEHEKEDYVQRGPATSFGDPNKSLETDTSSIAGEYRYDAERFNLTASYRHDKNSEFKDSNAWRTTGLIRMTDSTRLFASIGESTKNPTFTERFGFFDTFTGNPLLEPEESFGWELGVRQSMVDRGLDVSLSYFDQTLENEINGFVFDPGTGAFTAMNESQESKRSGTEIELSFAATDSLSLGGSYTYLDATEPTVSGPDIVEVRRPEHTAALNANYVFASGNVNLGILYNGKQEDDHFPPVPPFQERVELPSYTLVNLSMNYAVTGKVTLTGRMENLLDENYEDVYGYRAPGFGAHAGIKVEL